MSLVSVPRRLPQHMQAELQREFVLIHLLERFMSQVLGASGSWTHPMGRSLRLALRLKNAARHLLRP